MEEMVVSAVVQEGVSRVVSLLHKRKEKSTSQGHILERLEMAVNELELSVERSAKLPITDVSLLGRRKIIKRAYVEAMEQLDKYKAQAASAGQQHVGQGVKRPRWKFWCKATPALGLSMADVQRFEWYADCAHKFVRDVESGCSLYHNKICNPIVRHLLQGKTVQYFYLEQTKLARYFSIWPMYSDERGLEVVLEIHYEDSTMIEKNFSLIVFLGLSESTDIFGAAVKGLELLLTSGLCKLVAQCAMGELTMLSNLQDIAHSYRPPWVGTEEQGRYYRTLRPDPACCKGSRHQLYENNVVSSELSHIFPEHVTFCVFTSYYVQAIEARSSCSSFDVVGRRKSGDGSWKQPMVLTAAFAPHHTIVPSDEAQYSFAVEFKGNLEEFRGGSSINEVVETVNSDAINCFSSQPVLTDHYVIFWHSKHGCAMFSVEKGTSVPKTTRGYKTRQTTRRCRHGTNRSPCALVSVVSSN